MFIDVNRSLRLANHEGARIFAAVYSIPTSKAEYVNFKNSIAHGIDGFKYKFIDLYHFFNGHKSDSSWDMELEVIRKLTSTETPPAYWIERKEKLEKTGTGLDKLIGCHISSASKQLTFTKDFAFWPTKYEPKEIFPETVYATISAVLENLRENTISGDTLKSTAYEHYILDPENFIRFNDPLIQSCLWRAASPSELDYRCSDGDSMDMSHIILKLIKSKHTDRGQASLDLIMGLATRKIKLVPEHLNELILEASKIFTEDHETAILNYINSELVGH